MTRTSGLIKNNPVIALGMALPFVIVPTLSLKSGLMISLFIIAATVPAAMIAPIANKKIPMLYRVPCYSFIAMVFVVVVQVMFRHYAVLLDGLGLYIPMAALNSIMLELTVVNPRETPAKGLRGALLMCLGFSMVACGIGTLREILGNRTIWDIPFSVFPIKMGGVMLPFFGFILIGFLNALCRSIDRVVVRSMLAREPLYVQEEGEHA